MQKKVCAVTVSKNYLDRTKYSIKYLMIGKRKTDVPFWFVRNVGETGFDPTVLTGKAYHYSYKYDIPFFPHIRHGECVTEAQKATLKKYGVTV